MSTNPRTMQRSFEVMLQEIQQHHPELPPKIFYWATSHYYCGLAERSLSRGESQQAIAYLLKAIQLDYLPLFYPGRYRLFLNSLLHVAQHFWITKHAEQSTIEPSEPVQPLSLEELYWKIDRKRQSFLSQQRTRLLERRWRRIAQLYLVNG